jgi:hypothetical protein
VDPARGRLRVEQLAHGDVLHAQVRRREQPERGARDRDIVVQPLRQRDLDLGRQGCASARRARCPTPR